ncbi:hypothetical protein [Rhodococcus tibetensis]|uniref:Uncharacterized protein n=1 Tax=Rhodococcus tibetensis TaxID=2965064 RepID=A0ABT1QDT9_9NOCA|nr:hypothetical protein [Rhodococcus sp. FXJ9.536]MCQ4120410.1 hypothetical protein [Rhodococcus sp. FXJ9.536]
MMAPVPTEEQPTQCSHPARSAGRSTVATIVALAPVVPILADTLGTTTVTVLVFAVLLGNAGVSRLLASPVVEAALRHYVPILAAAPPAVPGRHRRDTPAA